MQNKSVTDNEESSKATPCNQSELIETLGTDELEYCGDKSVQCKKCKW